MSDYAFDKPGAASDVIFEVEGKKLHFSKELLKVTSPVFERMFTADFKEKDSEVIPLPGKTFADMDMFLQQLHPLHSWKPLNDDKLQAVLQLADEYQTPHVRDKCESYIMDRILMSHENFTEAMLSNRGRNDRLNPSSMKLPIRRVMSYLSLCTQSGFAEPEKILIKIASNKSVTDLESDANYCTMNEATQKAIFRERCLMLESREEIDGLDHQSLAGNTPRLIQLKPHILAGASQIARN